MLKVVVFDPGGDVFRRPVVDWKGLLVRRLSGVGDSCRLRFDGTVRNVFGKKRKYYFYFVTKWNSTFSHYLRTNCMNNFKLCERLIVSIKTIASPSDAIAGTTPRQHKPYIQLYIHIYRIYKIFSRYLKRFIYISITYNN